MLTNPQSIRLPTSQARDRFSEIIHFVQDPRASCILTRHGKAVAAVVSMAELRRLHKFAGQRAAHDQRGGGGACVAGADGPADGAGGFEEGRAGAGAGWGVGGGDGGGTGRGREAAEEVVVLVNGGAQLDTSGSPPSRG